MGYKHIDNLYKDTTILLFKECYALEKIHGTSAHIAYKDGALTFFSGGEPHENFVKLFDQEKLIQKCKELEPPSFTIYGEAYGGKQQGMSSIYGKELKFAAFEVMVSDYWLNVPHAQKFVESLGIEFVDYKRIPAELPIIDAERDADSTQAIRNGVGEGKMREGVVLRPPIEMMNMRGERIVAKHKRDEFKETKTPRVVDPERLKILIEATAISEEWVTDMRLTHILDKIPQPHDLSTIPIVIRAMLEDVQREGAGELVWSKDVERAIGSKTVILYKKRVTQL